jgi:hypothetical protein
LVQIRGNDVGLVGCSSKWFSKGNCGETMAIILDLKGIGYSFHRKLNSFDTFHLTPFKAIKII